MRKLRRQDYIWTKHAQEICARDGHDTDNIVRTLHLAGAYSDPNSAARIRLRLFDVHTIYVHPELEPYFGLLLVMDGRVIITMYNIIKDHGAPLWDYPGWRYWHAENSHHWYRPDQQQKPSTWEDKPSKKEQAAWKKRTERNKRRADTGGNHETQASGRL